MTEINDLQFLDVSHSFGTSTFSTLQFANALERMFPATMAELVSEYGKGGAGAGKHYSAFSRIAHVLDKLAKTRTLVKLLAPVIFNPPRASLI